MRYLFIPCLLASLLLSGCDKPSSTTTSSNASVAATQDAPPPAPTEPSVATMNSPVDFKGVNSMEDWEKMSKIVMSFEGVQNIQLSPQKEAGKIDQPLAYMRYLETTDKEALKAKLAAEGFEINIQRK